MSLDEKRYMSHLTETLSDSEEEREGFRDLRLQDINETQLLSEVEGLDINDKAYVFDTCFDILQSDKRLSVQELRFLKRLRKACKIGHFEYIRKMMHKRKGTRIKITAKRLFLGLFLLLGIYLLTGLITFGVMKHFGSKKIRPKEKSSGKEISVSILQFKDSKKPVKKTGQEIFQHVQGGIVSIKVFNKNTPLCGGSGFVLGTDDTGLLYIVTNKHVVHNEYTKKGKAGDVIRFEVQQHSGAKFGAKLDFYSRKHDIAILSVKGMEKYARPLKLTLKQNLNVGQTVYAVGSPIGLKDTFTSGVISALREKYLQTDATIYFGSSGGPLVDEYGGVCGVVTKGYEVKDYSFAIYSDTIVEVLEKRKQLKIESQKKK
jgi:V8-like Glu-specific endopeptidase